MSIKAKDFYIIRLRIYASPYLLKKHYASTTEGLPKQHHERIKTYIDFNWKFVEKITGKPMSWWYSEYMMNTVDCAKEHIADKEGIFFSDREAYKYYLIPKIRKDLYDWFLENVPASLPCEVKKRFIGIWLLEHWRKQTFQRDLSNQFMEGMRLRHPDIYGKLKKIT